MASSQSAGQYTTSERDYARLELQHAQEVAYRAEHPELLLDRSKGHLSESEVGILNSLPPVSDEALDAWLIQYGKPIRPSLTIPQAVYQKKRGSAYRMVGQAVAGVILAVSVASCNPSAYAQTPARPQITVTQATSGHMKNAAAGVGLGIAGLQFVRASKSLEKQSPNRKSFWDAYRS